MAKKERKKPAQEDAEEVRGEKPRAAERMPYLETNIDKLYNMVGKRKSMTFAEAAEEFDVSREQISSWAKILEDHKLAGVHYPVFGVPVIFAKETEESGMFGEDVPKKAASRKGPKLMIVMIAAGIFVFLGVVMVVNTPATIGIRAQLISLSGRALSPFSFLRYPLNIITPAAIIVTVAWVAFSARRRRKRKKESGEGAPEEKRKPRDKPEKGPEKKPEKSAEKKAKGSDIDEKIDRIKEKLGS